MFCCTRDDASKSKAILLQPNDSYSMDKLRNKVVIVSKQPLWSDVRLLGNTTLMRIVMTGRHHNTRLIFQGFSQKDMPAAIQNAVGKTVAFMEGS